MANAANSPFVKHPALLALFAPRPPPPFKVPIARRSMPKLTGIATFTSEFVPKEELAPIKKYETVNERRERIKTAKLDAHKKILVEREKKWDPHNNPNATKDPYKTLFVARLSYELSEDDLRREFERYGRIRDVKLIKNKETQKSRGYAFIEFERSNDLKEAFQHADGHKLKGRRILVDVERGRTVKTWKPRKLGGGLGKTRAGPSDKNKNSNNDHSSSHHRPHSDRSNADRHRRKKPMDSTKYSSRRDKYRDRDYRDRDRDRDRDRRTDRKDRGRHGGGRDRDRDRERERDNKRSRSRDKKDRKRRDKKDGKERTKYSDNRDRDRDRERVNNRDRDRERRNDRDNKDRSSRKDKEKERSRRHRSRSKEKTRRR